MRVAPSAAALAATTMLSVRGLDPHATTATQALARCVHAGQETRVGLEVVVQVVVLRLEADQDASRLAVKLLADLPSCKTDLILPALLIGLTYSEAGVDSIEEYLLGERRVGMSIVQLVHGRLRRVFC